MVDTIVRGVIARRPTAHPSEVEWLVRKELERFRDARITQFIPVLVERAVLVRLAASPAEERQEAQVS